MRIDLRRTKLENISLDRILARYDHAGQLQRTGRAETAEMWVTGEQHDRIYELLQQQVPLTAPDKGVSWGGMTFEVRPPLKGS